MEGRVVSGPSILAIQLNVDAVNVWFSDSGKARLLGAKGISTSQRLFAQTHK